MHTLYRDPSLNEFVEILQAVQEPWGAKGSAASLTKRDHAMWKALFEVDDVFDEMLRWSQQFQMLVAIPESKTVSIIKYKYVDELEVNLMPFSREEFGLGPLTMWIDLGHVGNGSRTHIRFLAPDGFIAKEMALVELETGKEFSPTDERLTPERAMLYIRDLPAGRFWLSLKLNVRRSTFVAPAGLSTLFMFVLLAVATWLQAEDQRFSSAGAVIHGQAGTSPDAAVTILALIPSVLAIYFVRAGEHALVTRVLLVSRAWVGLSAALTVFAAASVAADVEPENLFLVLLMATTIAATTTSLLGIIFLRTSRRWWKLWAWVSRLARRWNSEIAGLMSPLTRLLCTKRA